MKSSGSGTKRGFVRIGAWFVSAAGIVFSLTWNNQIEEKALILLKENAAVEASLPSYSAEYWKTVTWWDDDTRRHGPCYFLSTLAVARADHSVDTKTWRLTLDRMGRYSKETLTEITNPVECCPADHQNAAGFWTESGSHYGAMRDLARLPHTSLVWVANEVLVGHSRHLVSLHLLEAKESVDGVPCDVVTFRWDEYYCPRLSHIHEGRLYVGPDKLLRREFFTDFAISKEAVSSTSKAQVSRTTCDAKIRNIRTSLP